MTLLRIGVIAEDARFGDFLVPAVQQLADNQGAEVEIVSVSKVGGCRPRVLRAEVERASVCDLVVVGADASAPGHRTRARSHRQKSRHMIRFLGPGQGRSFAIAAPSIEAWLYCEAGCFAGGLEEALGVPFRMPDTWPEPEDEREAKSQLGRLIRDGTVENLLRGGFEYADRIVARMPLEVCKNVSLAHWAREFAATFRRLGAEQ